MIIGIPTEIKSDEYRVAMIPVGVEELTKSGHQVLIQHDAGSGSGIEDEAYVKHGAKVVDSAEEIFERAELIVKVKEPQDSEIKLMRKGQIIFTYFHFAASRALTERMLKSGATAIAYETITDGRSLPLLTPMSEVAGKMSIQEGAKYLERPQMGPGILLGGVPGVAPANVLIIGGGVVGINAAKIGAGLGANVVIMDISIDRLRYLDDIMADNVTTIYSDAHTIRKYLPLADLIVGAVLIPGARTPRLISREDLKHIKNQSVIVDVAVDQGGCVETTRPTTHQNPTYIEEGVVHYAVANMPGAVGRTSTYALCNVTLPYAVQIANCGALGAAKTNPAIASGVNIIGGKVTNKAVAQTFEMAYHAVE